MIPSVQPQIVHGWWTNRFEMALMRPEPRAPAPAAIVRAIAPRLRNVLVATSSPRAAPIFDVFYKIQILAEIAR